MRLTRFTDYSLRVLIALAIDPERSVTIQEISESYGVSNNHLMKIAHQLGRLGYIETVRGRNGGLRLARDAAEISLGDVVRDCEEDRAIVECFDPATSTCRIEPGCTLRHVIEEALSAFFEVLDQYTLADLAKRKGKLRSLLGLPPLHRSRRGTGARGATKH